MKYLITESQSDNIVSKIIDDFDIKFDIMYWCDNGRDSVTATVYLYKDGEILGHKHGYEFHFKYDSRFNSLTPNGHWPHIERVDVFGFMPSGPVIKFFSDKAESHLKKFIDSGYSNLKRK
jgi:hypothetical protein